MKLKERYCYPAKFIYEEGQEIAVVFPDLDVATSGIDDEDAQMSARELLGMVMNGLEEDGEEIPVPTPLNELKLKDNEKSLLVDVYMPSIRKANINKSVSRTVTVPAWLNARAMEYDINFSQVLQEGLKKELNIK